MVFRQYRASHEVHAIEDPDLAAQPQQAGIVQIYLADESVSLVPFRRRAERWPVGADQVFARILGQPNFSWAKDGDAMLRSAKPKQADRIPRPLFVPVGPRLAEHLRSRRADPQPIATV